MHRFTGRDEPAQPTHLIEIVEPACDSADSRLRHLNDNLLAYSQATDINGSPCKLPPKFDLCTPISPPRAKILELLRPEDPGHDALEAIVRPIPRRGLTRPLDEDTRRFLQRALQSPAQYVSNPSTPEPQVRPPEPIEKIPQPVTSTPKQNPDGERSLADELREAEEDERAGGHIRRELLREFRKRGGGIRDAVERERMGKLALSVEDDEGDEESGLSAAARRIDALLAESRDLHEELAGIQEDLQAESVRACRCAAAARALVDESQALRYLDDVVALLRGDVAAAARVRAWPFAIGRRQPGRNYII
ncbi:uncharacterized protein LOC115445347 [Manduca sexta]|uniref:uncharacterized protein LOC115445347 n=1 Tax=Manduca sexta TaxID=7130 RepID=UPI00188F1CFD|nr:uncharacterized protein LOC115445347 [Manduca sexta]